jgi:hypothetical protein
MMGRRVPVRGCTVSGSRVATYRIMAKIEGDHYESGKVYYGRRRKCAESRLSRDWLAGWHFAVAAPKEHQDASALKGKTP